MRHLPPFGHWVKAVRDGWGMDTRAWLSWLPVGAGRAGLAQAPGQ